MCTSQHFRWSKSHFLPFLTGKNRRGNCSPLVSGSSFQRWSWTSSCSSPPRPWRPVGAPGRRAQPLWTMELDRGPARTWPQTAWQQRSPRNSCPSSLSAKIHGQQENEVFTLNAVLLYRSSWQLGQSKGITKQKGTFKSSSQTKCFSFLFDSFIYRLGVFLKNIFWHLYSINCNLRTSIKLLHHVSLKECM